MTSPRHPLLLPHPRLAVRHHLPLHPAWVALHLHLHHQAWAVHHPHPDHPEHLGWV